MPLIDKKNYTTVCSCHKELIFLTRKPKHTFIMMDSTSIGIINELSKLAYSYGCSMENRLKLYKKAVFQLNKTYTSVDHASYETKFYKLEKAILLLNKKLGFDPYEDKGLI